MGRLSLKIIIRTGKATKLYSSTANATMNTNIAGNIKFDCFYDQSGKKQNFSILACVKKMRKDDLLCECQ